MYDVCVSYFFVIPTQEGSPVATQKSSITEDPS
jgi:hypothetical protein